MKTSNAVTRLTAFYSQMVRCWQTRSMRRELLGEGIWRPEERSIYRLWRSHNPQFSTGWWCCLRSTWGRAGSSYTIEFTFRSRFSACSRAPLCSEATVTSSSPLGLMGGWHFLSLSFISSLICKVVRRYRRFLLLLLSVLWGASGAWGTILSYKQEMQTFTGDPGFGAQYQLLSCWMDSTPQQELNILFWKA